MNRQNFFTAMGIVFSLAIAIGGWALTSMLIDIKSDALLEARGLISVYVPASVPPAPANDDDDPDPAGNDFLRDLPKLTESEIFRILLNWESDGLEQLHEPAEDQLTMEQALEVSKAGLNIFYEQGIVPAELFDYNNTNAYLYENRPRGKENKLLTPFYSYWLISFFSENGMIKLTVNAVTGQIWRAEMSLNPSGSSVLEEINAEKALDVFTDYLGLTGSGSYTSSYTIEESMAYKSYANNMFYAIVQSACMEKKKYLRIVAYLSTQEPGTATLPPSVNSDGARG